MTKDGLTRREAVLTGAALAGGAAALLRASEAQAAPAPVRKWEESYSGGPPDAKPSAPGMPGRDYVPVVTPGGATLPWKIVDGVKVYHLVAEEVEHEFTPGLKATCWGYNGRVHGPTLEAVEGDRVREYATNRLPAPTSVHWHGVFLPSAMAGVAGLSQRSIKPG
ncbi:MAG TPA: multicopper oxidase domain-containing protein, partial [Polyangiaceae bacterium]